MKIETWTAGQGEIVAGPGRWTVSGETDRLTDVMLGVPLYLEPVPCCSVTRESLLGGFRTSTAEALRQHRALADALRAEGVRCHMLPPAPGLADLCFTRDGAVMTPWGLIGLKPRAAHRVREVDHVLAAAAGWGVDRLGRIEAGHIEGGDICVVRPGLAIVGCSGERTTPEGAEALAAIFRRHGWEVLVHRFDPHFLHLDTQFCMVDANTALACVDVLDDGFLARLAALGIGLIPVSYKEARRLGCNILSLGDGRVLAAEDNGRVNDLLRRRGHSVVPVPVSQFAACGGGIHCLTMPLARADP